MSTNGIRNEIDRIAQNIDNTYTVLSALGADMPTERISDNLARTAGTAKAVLYSDQDLTEDQKEQARANIGAPGVYFGDEEPTGEDHPLWVDPNGEGYDYLTSQDRTELEERINNFSNEKADYLTYLKPNRIINMAHRGAMPEEIPENTLPACAKAGAMGFDYIEVDLRFTADGVPVNLHDETINRTARNADGSVISETIKIADITYQQALGYVFCGELQYGLYDSYPDVKIPTVEEVVALCKTMGVGVCFDLYPALSTADIELIYSILDKYNMRDNVIMGSSSYPNVQAIVEYYPKAVVSTRTSTYGDPTTEGYDVVLPKVLNGLRSVYTGKNYVIGNVRTDRIEKYGPVLLENGFGISLSTIPVTDEELQYAAQKYTHIMAETYVPTVRLREIAMKGEAPVMLTKAEYDALIERITALEGGGEPVNILNLNRTQGTSWNNSEAETNYINPAAYGSTVLNQGNACIITNLTENSITVQEGGTGGQGVAFPLLIINSSAGIDRRGKSYLLTWDATGTTDTRFRLMFGNGSVLKNADLDNKNGTITSATIDISEDGNTVTVNGTATTETTPFVWMAFHFSAATGKTVSYTGVSLVEVTE